MAGVLVLRRSEVKWFEVKEEEGLWW